MYYPLVSVITPVFNREQYLSECIKSILSQSYVNFEFIIVDDNSSDNTNKIIKDYASKDSRIKILKNDKNVGPALSFNCGLNISKGKYIARMDSDDISLPERFQKQINIFENWNDLEAIGAGAIIIDHEGNEIGKKKFPSNYKKIKKILNYGVPVFDPSVMIRSNFLKEIKGLDNRLEPADDYHLWLTLFKNKKIISNINDYLIKYRLHDTNRSKLALKEQLQKTFFAHKIYNNNLSVEEFFEKDIYKELSNFQKLIVKNWNGTQTSLEGSIYILKGYFESKEYLLYENEAKILAILKSLLIKRRFILFFRYLLKFIIRKFIK